MQYESAFSRQFSNLVNSIAESVAENLQPKQGLTQEYFDKLERVDNKTLSPEDECPICVSKYVDDPYQPLAVYLPCPGRHMFDLDCIAQWLKDNNTCPVCRYDLVRKRPDGEASNAANDGTSFIYFTTFAPADMFA